MNEKYANLKNKVAPQTVMCMDHLSDDYFADALWICKRLGLVPLMTRQQDYNIQVIQHFFSTLVFGQQDTVDFYWMPETLLANLPWWSLGPCWDMSTVVQMIPPMGKGCMHVEGVQYSKKKLAPLYASEEFEAGKAKGLKLFYNILLRIF
jgi:hypothetical protein